MQHGCSMARTYTTVQGDTWDSIAYRLWGRETLMHLLLAANTDHADVLVFEPDVLLNVPDITVPARTMPLPPWMQGATA